MAREDSKDSVLSLADQKAGRIPDHCVWSGARTEFAVRVSAYELRVPSFARAIPGMQQVISTGMRAKPVEVVLPVTKTVWARWRRRELLCLAMATIGAVLGGLTTEPGGLVVGASLAVCALLYRDRLATRYWVRCYYDRDRDHIVVSPTHQAFDRDARELFQRRLS